MSRFDSIPTLTPKPRMAHRPVASDPLAVPKHLLRALRPHQWAKNVLLVLPLVAAHRVGDVGAWVTVGVAFVALSMIASGTYLVNDLMDLPADRKHPQKRHRPLASGALPLNVAGIAAGMLVLGGLMLGLAALPLPAVLWLMAYTALTIAYSMELKRRCLVDVITLAGLYTLRILLGAAAVGVMVSHWLLAFSMFLFISLAFAKRYIEAAAMADTGDGDARPGKLARRGYMWCDADMIRTVGPVNGYLAVLVIALYINNPDVNALYSSPFLLWLVCPLLFYWISRIWFLAHRGQLHHDPVLFALRDPHSYAVGLASAGIILAASLL